MEQGRLCRISHLSSQCFALSRIMGRQTCKARHGDISSATPKIKVAPKKILLEINRDDFDEQISLVSHDLVAICVSCVRCGLFVVLVLVVDREGELVTYRTPGPAPWSAPGPALAARPGPAHHSHSVISCRS